MMFENHHCMPGEALCVAQELRSGATSQAVYRAVCSRAYYAAFQAAREFQRGAANPGSVGDSDGGTHDQLISQLDNPQGGKNRRYWVSKGIAKSLRLAYQHRLSSDYFFKRPVSENNADESLRMAAAVIEKVITPIEEN